MKLELLVSNEESLKTLVETEFDDAQLAWDLAESFDDVEKALTKFQKKREEFVQGNGTPDPENPERYIIPDLKVFEDEMRKILDVEIDIGGTPYHFTVYPTKA